MFARVALPQDSLQASCSEHSSCRTVLSSGLSGRTYGKLLFCCGRPLVCVRLQRAPARWRSQPQDGVSGRHLPYFMHRADTCFKIPAYSAHLAFLKTCVITAHVLFGRCAVPNLGLGALRERL